jgi:hypothetical protein
MHDGKLLVKSGHGYLTFPEFLRIQGPIEEERARYIAPELMKELHSQANLSNHLTEQSPKITSFSQDFSEVPTK